MSVYFSFMKNVSLNSEKTDWYARIVHHVTIQTTLEAFDYISQLPTQRRF